MGQQMGRVVSSLMVTCCAFIFSLFRSLDGSFIILDSEMVNSESALFSCLNSNRSLPDGYVTFWDQLCTYLCVAAPLTCIASRDNHLLWRNYTGAVHRKDLVILLSCVWFGNGITVLPEDVCPILLSMFCTCPFAYCSCKQGRIIVIYECYCLLFSSWWQKICF